MRQPSRVAPHSSRGPTLDNEIMFVDIVFDGPPGPESGRFVEVENQHGRSVNVGEWVHRPGGYRALRTSPSDSTSLASDSTNAAVELQKIYDSEINVRIGWFWDCGIEIRFGDDVNGYLAEETVRTVAEIVPRLQEAVSNGASSLYAPASLDKDKIFRTNSTSSAKL